MTAPVDLAIVGSGPAGSVAALQAASLGASVVVLERSVASPVSSTDQWFSFDRTAAVLEHRGAFTPRPPSRLSLGVPDTLGGGFAANSGLYCWPSDHFLSTWSQQLTSADLESARLEVESRLYLDRSTPRSPSAEFLSAVAFSMNAPSENLSSWHDPNLSSINPFLTAALSHGASIRQSSRVVKITSSGSNRILHLSDGSTITARTVVLAAGTLGSFTIAASSGLCGSSTSVAGHPMLKSVLFPPYGVPTSLEPIPGRTQVVHSAKVRSGCALSLPWALVANHPEMYDRLRSCWSEGVYPFGWYTQAAMTDVLRLKVSRSALKVSQRGSLTKDPLFKEAASAHLKLLKASGCNFAFAGTPHLPFSPKELLRHPRVSMVHMTSSLPLDSALLEDGVFPSDPQVGCVDSAALPSTPGVNPQAITMAFATLVSRRMFDRFQKVWA